MEEMLKIIYFNFLDDEEASEKVNVHHEKSENAILKLEPILNVDLYSEVREEALDAVSDLRECLFMLGFAYGVQMVSSGKVNLFDMVINNGGAA